MFIMCSVFDMFINFLVIMKVIDKVKNNNKSEVHKPEFDDFTKYRMR